MKWIGKDEFAQGDDIVPSGTTRLSIDTQPWFIKISVLTAEFMLVSTVSSAEPQERIQGTGHVPDTSQKTAESSSRSA